MKIAFLTSRECGKQFQQIYALITEYLQQKGHSVLRNGDSKTCDMIIAECSTPCISIGYEIANALQQGKEVIILKHKNASTQLLPQDSLYTHKNIYLYEYTDFDLLSILKEAIAYNPSQKFKKYNILFPTAMVTKLNNIAKKKNLPKSVYIRQLLEKGLATEDL